MKNFTQKFIGLFALVFSISFTINAQQIGDIYEGGYIFQINEDGTGLVADLQDLGQMNWNDALGAAENSSSQGYNDWYLPSIEELELMYSTIGKGGPEGNIGGFEDGTAHGSLYWSSSEHNNNTSFAVRFSDGYTFASIGKQSIRGVRAIRAF